MKFIDSSIWLDHLGNTNSNASTIIVSQDFVYCSVLSIFEIERKLRQLKLDKHIQDAITLLKERALIVGVSEEITHLAAELSIKYKLGAIDALIYASAQYLQVPLITGDNDFRGLPEVEIIDKQ